MSTAESRIAALLSVLSETEDAMHCPLSEFARSMREASWAQQRHLNGGAVGSGRPIELSDVLAERSLQLLREEESILRDEEVVRITYDKLRAEMARVEAQLQSLGRRAQEVVQQKAFCRVAMNLLVSGDVPEFYTPDTEHVVGAPREYADATNNNAATTTVDGTEAAPEAAPMSSTSPKRPRRSTTSLKGRSESQPQLQPSLVENGSHGKSAAGRSPSTERNGDQNGIVENGKASISPPQVKGSSRLHGVSDPTPTGTALLAMLRLPDVKETTLLNAIESYDEYHFGRPITWRAKKQEEVLPVLLGMLKHLPTPRPPIQLAELRILGHIFRSSSSNRTASESILSSSQMSASLSEGIVGSMIYSLLTEGQAVPILTRLLQSVNNDIKCEVLECLLPLIINSSTISNDADHRTDKKRILPDTRKEFIAAGGLQPLVSIVTSCTSEAVLERSLVLLWNLIARDDEEEKIRSEVRRLGGLRVVLDLLYTDSIPILDNAAMTIGYITREESSKIEIREAGGLEKITATLRHPFESIQTKMAGAVWNCASNAENRTYLRQIGCIPALLELLSSPYEFVQENAAGALWNLSVDPENKAQILDYGGIVELSQLIAKSNSVGVVENASGTLWNCSAAVETRPAIRKAAAIPILLSVLSRDSPSSARQGNGLVLAKKPSTSLPISDKILDNVAGTLRNCAINDQNKPAIREAGGVELLLGKLEQGISKYPASIPAPTLDKIASTLWILTISPEIKHSVRLSGGIPLLAKILESTSLTAAKKKKSKVIVQLTMSLKEKIVGILRNCSTVQENRPAMVAAGVVQALVYAVEDCYISTSTETNTNKATSQQSGPSLQLKETVASALWYLSRDDKVTPREEGGLELVCRLLKEPNQPSVVLEQAAGAISSLTVNNNDNRTKLRDFGGLDALLRVIEEKTPLAFPQQARTDAVGSEAVSSTINPAVHSSSGTNKAESAVSNTYAVLNTLLSIRNSTSSNEGNLRYVAEWRYRCQGGEARTAGASSSLPTSFTGWLLYIIQHGSDDCAREAALCVKNLCSQPKALESLLQQDAVELLGGLAERGSSDSVRRAAAMTLHSLARAQRR